MTGAAVASRAADAASGAATHAAAVGDILLWMMIALCAIVIAALLVELGRLTVGPSDR